MHSAKFTNQRDAVIVDFWILDCKILAAKRFEREHLYKLKIMVASALLENLKLVATLWVSPRLRLLLTMQSDYWD